MATQAARLKVDLKDFNRTMRSLQKTSSKEAQFFLNEQGRRLAWEAFRATPSASATEIEMELGQSTLQSGTRVVKRGKRAGQTVPVLKKQFTGKLIYRIINAKRIRRGEAPLWGPEMGKEATKEINSRKKGIGYMKSGWLPVIGAFSAAVGKPFGKGGIRSFGKAKGIGKPAKSRNLARMVATLINGALKERTKNSSINGKAYDIGMKVMRQAISYRLADMKKELARRMGKVARQHSAR